MTKIDTDTVLSVMEQIVAEFGEDYVYTDHYDSCQYVSDDGQPACIVGQVLARLDLPLPGPSSSANMQAWAGWSGNTTGTYREPFTDEANAALRKAQMVQDGDVDDFSDMATMGRSWGRALAYAKGQVK